MHALKESRIEPHGTGLIERGRRRLIMYGSSEIDSYSELSEA